LPIEGVTDAGLGFHTQQTVEKSLKAVLSLRRVEFPYTHDLDVLLELCESSGVETPSELSNAGSLSPFAAQLRYGATSATGLDRDKAMTWAAMAVGWAREIVEDDRLRPPCPNAPGEGATSSG
jgi:HEPN domain-containing protein